MKIKIYYVLLICLITALKAYTQQLPIYSQYMMNSFLINPAAAGAEGYTAFNLTAREQWLGFEDAPKTHAVSIQSRILRKSFISRGASIRRKRRLGTRSGRVGYGVYLFDDKNGLIGRTGLQGTYSYHLRIGSSQLSFGASLSTYQFRINKDKAKFDVEGDPLFDGKPTTFVPDANFGAYYSTADYYGGFSISQLTQSKLQLGDIGDGEYAILRHYNFLGGYIYKVNYDFSVEPSLLIKYPEGLRPQIDVNTKVTYKDDYWGGLSYRTGQSVVLFLGVKFDKFYFGYAFDYTLQSIGKYTIGSHEVMIAVKFGDNAKRYRWLNRY